MYKVLIVVEAMNSGLSTQIAEFDHQADADECVFVIENGPGTGVDGQIIRAVKLYQD